jgi:hypothetical protein
MQHRRAGYGGKRRRRRLSLPSPIFVAIVTTITSLVVVPTAAAHGRTGSGVDRLVRTTIPVGTGATDVAVGAGGVWVPGVDVVRRVDPGRRAVSSTVPVPGSSDYRSATVAFGAVWITDTGTGLLTRIDGDVVTSIELGDAPTKAVATTDRLWVVQGDGRHAMLTPVDPATMTAGAPIQLDDTREAFPGLAARGDVLYVAYGPQLLRYDTRTGATLSSAEHVTRALAVVGNDVAAITGDHRVVRFDGDTLDVRRVGPVVPAAQDLAAGDDVIWVLAQSSSVRASKVWRVDPRTLAPVGRPATTGLTSTGLAADGDRAWVANFSDSTVTRLESRPRNRA